MDRNRSKANCDINFIKWTKSFYPKIIVAELFIGINYIYLIGLIYITYC
jgi:hypothetical protein